MRARIGGWGGGPPAAADHEIILLLDEPRGFQGKVARISRLTRQGRGSHARAWDGHNPLTELDSAEGKSTWVFEPETFNPLAKLAEGRVWGVLTDQIGTPTELITEDGGLAWRGLGTAGGEHDSASPAQPFAYPGQQLDSDVGLFQNRFRWFDPALGGFLAKDPLGTTSSYRGYAYPENPLVERDPSGLIKLINLLEQRDLDHILYGDKPGSGGHLWPGQPGKTTFPYTWSPDRIAHEVIDIVTDPSTRWYAQTGSGNILTAKHKPAVWRAWETRGGVRIRVAFEPATGRVRTAFPDNSAPKATPC